MGGCGDDIGVGAWLGSMCSTSADIYRETGEKQNEIVAT